MNTTIITANRNGDAELATTAIDLLKNTAFPGC